jgi:hypothetical protein
MCIFLILYVVYYHDYRQIEGKKLKNQGNPADNVSSVTLTDEENNEQE